METVTLRAFDNYFQANLLLSRLRDSGIECYLKDEFTVTIDPLLSNALGGIKLIVRKENYPEAVAMLQSFQQQNLTLIKCPVCGTNDFSTVPAKNAKNFTQGLLGWLFSTDSPSVDNIYKCNNCGYESENLPEVES